MHRLEANLCAQLVYAFRVREFPRPNPAIHRIIQPLCPVALRAALVHGDSVFEVRGVPTGNAALFCGTLQEQEALSLKCGTANRMLGNQPGCFGSILAYRLLIRPAMEVYQLAKTLSIPDVHSLHSRNIAAAKLTRIDQFLTNSQIFSPHCDEFLAEGIIQHE